MKARRKTVLYLVRRAVANSLLDKLKKPIPKQSTEPLYERLNLLKY
jgi:ATP-dependent Clp protease protease subunit